MTEQRYKAVLAVISDGRTVTEVARDWNVCRQTLHEWLGRYEDEGLEGLANRSLRPEHCPHPMTAEIEAQLLELRRARPYLGARRLAIELARTPLPPPPRAVSVALRHKPAKYLICTMCPPLRYGYVPRVAPRVKVMARRVNGKSPVPPIVYSASVFPDDGELHVTPLWSCPHEHNSPDAAQQCGFDWIEAQASNDKSQGLTA